MTASTDAIWDRLSGLRRSEVVEVESRLVAMDGRTYHGHEGVRSLVATTVLGAFPDYAVEVQELRDLGDVTLVRIIRG